VLAEVASKGKVLSAKIIAAELPSQSQCDEHRRVG
jgi:hypothetical protein